MEIDWKQFLQGHSVFSTIRDKRRIAALVQSSEEREFKKDTEIVHQGDAEDFLFLIGSGSAQALLEVGEGESIQLSTMREGEVFGEMAFFEHRPRAATVRAKEDCMVLKIPAEEFQKLAEEYPQIEVRLLVKMSERLRQTNERMLAQVRSVDEKLKRFNDSINTERRAADAEIKAAQVMFDQTKLRAQEVIDSAERSRSRITWFASTVGAFVTVLIAILGAIGVKEALSLHKVVETVRNDAKEVEKIRKDAEDSVKGVKDVQGYLIGIYRTRFSEALSKGSLKDVKDARNTYNLIRDLHGLDEGGLGELLQSIEVDIAVKAQRKNIEDEKAKVDEFVGLIRAAETEAKSSRDKLYALYLRLIYEYVNGHVKFEDARAELERYVRSTQEVPLRNAPYFAEWINKEPGKRGSDMRTLSELARITLDSPKT